MKIHRQEILREIDRMDTYTEKLETLNELYLQALTKSDEMILLDMIEELKNYGG